MSGTKKYEILRIEVENTVLEFAFSATTTDFTYRLTDSPHMHMIYEFHYVFEGSCPITVNDVKTRIPENALCIVPSNTIHYFPPTDENCKGFGFVLSVKHEKSTPNPFLFPDEFKIIEGNERICRYMEDFLAAYKNKGFGSDFIKKSALTLLVFAVLEELGQNDAGGQTGSESDALDDGMEIDSFIMRNYTRNIKLADVAAAVGFSTTHTGRIIKKNHGISYSELILQLRMAHAKKLILTTDMPFCDIGVRVGYNSYNGFGAAFKKYFGESPEQMRQA